MKKWFLIAAALVMVPAVVMAGMSAVSQKELGEVQGQTGVTLQITALNVVANTVAWGDDNGFAPYTTAGWAILGGVDLPNVHIGGLFDVGGNTTTTYFLWTKPTTIPLLEGNLTVADIILGSSATSTTPSLGELRVNSLVLDVGTPIGGGLAQIRIAAHN
ncbi:MAG: DUF6160 family protein [Thermodesulfobacteriota bacterium]